MLAKIFSAAPLGVSSHIIEIEASLENALPQIHITGLPGTVVRESRDRIRACLNALGKNLPSGRVTLHLSPAELPKSGSHYDLPMALCLLGAENKLKSEKLATVAALGELSLDGRIRKVSGAIALLENLDQDPKIEAIFLSKENLVEARMIQSKKMYLVDHVSECFEILSCETPVNYTVLSPIDDPPLSSFETLLDHVMGQSIAKRALEISLAGDHHFLMVGSPGVGKSLLASCVESLLPSLTKKERIELHKIYGVPGVREPIPSRRPFRNPHHSISQAGLLGGGTGIIVPGEVSLAHQGVLFLDEIPEFRRDSLEGLREPLQNGTIHHHRSMISVTYPARFVLIAAMNPCPCGLSMSREKSCRCSFDQVNRYRKRLSGPFLDRIQLAVIMQDRSLLNNPSRSHSQTVDAIQSAKDRKMHRKGSLTLGEKEEAWLDQASNREGLSFRGKANIVRVAETIADLANTSVIKQEHLQEAWSFRCSNFFDRFQNC